MQVLNPKPVNPQPKIPEATSSSKPAVTNDQISTRIQQLINDLGTLPKSDARILAIGKLNGAIMRLQTGDNVAKGGK